MRPSAAGAATITALLLSLHSCCGLDILPTGIERCHYGTLPGRWVAAAEPGAYPTWMPFSADCQLTQILDPYIQTTKAGGNPSALRPLNILLFGDSVDFRLPQHLCEDAFGVFPDIFGHPEHQQWHMTAYCNASGLTVAKQHISGTKPAGPYWHGLDFPPMESITEGLAAFQERAGGEPDIAVVSSLFWDISTMFFLGGFTTEGTPLEKEILDDAVVCAYRRNLTAVLKHVKASVPRDTLLVYHTLHTPRLLEDKRYWESDVWVRQHIAQLNAAGRQAAADVRFQVVDMEAMANHMGPDTLLADNSHPNRSFMLQVLNMLLNMEAGHRARLARFQAEHLLRASGPRPELRSRAHWMIGRMFQP